MRNINFSDVLSNVLFSLLAAAGTATITLLIYYFSLNGAIDYSVAKDKQSFFVTFYISNDRSEPADIEIGMPASIEAVVASSGTAGIDILNPAGRVGSILSITKIPPKSDYSAIVRSPAAEGTLVPSLLRAPTGVGLHLADPTRGRINFLELTAQSAMYALIMFLFLSHFDKRISENKELIANLEKKLAEVRATLEGSTAKLSAASSRYKVYTLGIIRYLNSENDFWRSVVERILVSESASKGRARQLLLVIAKRFGYKSMRGIEDKDLDFIIASLIDEEKRKRFEEMLK